ncbi:MAG TPA: cytochrome P460 [Gammaproteobacteria bacterium]|nr:cytochrome P460 [Gammaproteobacteria bacterium]
MKALRGILFCLAGGLSTTVAAHGPAAPAPNGLELPEGYADWRVISISHRIDNNTLRVILGNDIAIEAARKGHTNPWPDGTVLGKVVWKQAPEADWPKAIAPSQFVHAEFMYRDSKRWAGNGTGWGWARWTGEEQKPYGKAADFDQECIACHTPVKGRDWVFTTPARLPVVFGHD